MLQYRHLNQQVGHALLPQHNKGENCILNGIIILKCYLVLHLCINDKYQSSGSSEYHLIIKGWVEEINLAREVPNLEIDKGAAGDVILVDLVGAFQEQGFIWRHFVEHHLKTVFRFQSKL